MWILMVSVEPDGGLDSVALVNASVSIFPRMFTLWSKEDQP